MTTTFERLSAILARDYKVEPQALTLDAPLDALGIDSLGSAELLFTIEDEFQVTAPREAVALSTVGDVVRFIDALMLAPSATPLRPLVS